MLAWITTSTYQRKIISVKRHLEITVVGKYMDYTELHLNDGSVLKDFHSLSYVNTQPVVEKFYLERDGQLTKPKYL